MAALVLASIAASACGGTSVAGYASRVDSRAVTDLVFQARASTTAQVNSSTLGAAVKIMRSRLGDLGVGGATVTESGGDEIVVRLPNVKNAAEVASVLGAGGQLYFYDWEESVIGPNGQPAGPNNGASTGDDPTDQGGDPGTSVNALSEYQAIERAAKRPAMHLKLMSAPYGTLYYVDPATQKVLTLSEAIVPAPGNAAARQQAVGYLNADIADAGNKLPAGAKLVYIKPGTVVRQALTPNDTSDPGYNYYYVLQDDPVISGEDITNPIEQIDPTSAQPVVAFGFKGPAIRPFEALTAQLARRGSENSTGNNHNFQHFAITLDNQIVSVPYVDYTQYPSGVDANEGGEIAGDFTIASARALAAVLASGQLPLQLYEIPSTHS